MIAEVTKKSGYKPCGATVEELKAAFTGRCDICGIPESDSSGKLCMDHSHKSGRFRGYTCCKCNSLLGMAGDSARVLENALDYIMSYKQNE